MVSTADSAKIRLGMPVYRDAQHVICVCENSVLTYSVDAPNPHYLKAWAQTVELVLGQFQGGLFVLTVIDRNAHAPDDVSKASIRNTIVEHAARIDAFAYVVDGEGFRAAAMRSALSLIALAARYPFPQKVFGRVEDAVPWMLRRPYHADREPRQAPDAAKLIKMANSMHGQLKSVAAAG